MDLGKNHTISADYKDRRSSPQWELRLFAEVIFIDKGHHGLHPLIYQLRDNAFPSLDHIIHWKTNAIKLPNEAFSLLGEAAAFDRKKKQILLTNHNTVAYNYLIVGSENSQRFTIEDQKFMDAFHALIEALRLQQKIPMRFSHDKSPHATSKKKAALGMQQLNAQPPSSTIEQVAMPYICQVFDPKSLDSPSQPIDKRLYEVNI